MLPEEEPITLAIVGLGRFARKRILPAIATCAGIDLCAVVSRKPESHNLPDKVKVYRSLEDLHDACKVSAVYVATPNSLHAENSIQCLSAGMHVLCEKPMCIVNDDVERMITCARDQSLALLIGHMLRFSPALSIAKEWLQAGWIGEPESIRTAFNYNLQASDRPWAFRRELAGGGSLLDAGTHCIDAIRFLIDGDVKAIKCMTDRKKYSDGLERNAECELQIGPVEGRVEVSSVSAYSSALDITGRKGIISIDNFAATWGNVAVKIFDKTQDKPNRIHEVDVSDIYSAQLDYFLQLVRAPDSRYTLARSAGENVRIVNSLYECAGS